MDFSVVITWCLRGIYRDCSYDSLLPFELYSKAAEGAGLDPKAIHRVMCVSKLTVAGARLHAQRPAAWERKIEAGVGEPLSESGCSS